MCGVRSYSVAGFGFCIDGAPFEPSNLEPFRAARKPQENLFTLHVVPSLEAYPIQPFYQTDDGPDFPEITLWKKAQGYRVQMRPLPTRPVVLGTKANVSKPSTNERKAWNLPPSST